MKLPGDGLFEKTELLNLAPKQEQLQRRSIMTATSAMNPARPPVPSKHGAASRTGTDSGLLIATGLFLVVLIVETLLIAITATSSFGVGGLYVSTT